MKRLDRLYERVMLKSKSDIEDISTVDNGYFSTAGNELDEFFSWVSRLFKKYDIGKKISRKYWGDRKKRELQKVLYDAAEKQADDRVTLKKPAIQIYDDLRKDVKSKDHSKSDFARVARTETAAVKALYQLEGFKKSGMKQVQHKTKNDGKVSKICKLHSNKFYDIDYLLSKRGEKDRIPLHPNCRCRYQMTLRGTK